MKCIVLVIVGIVFLFVCGYDMCMLVVLGMLVVFN